MAANTDHTYIPLNEAARIAGRSRTTLRQAAQRGSLRAVKVGRDWMTTRAWLDAYLRNRQSWYKSKPIEDESS